MKSRIFGLDVMRSIAILMVVFVHSINSLTIYLPLEIIGPIIGKLIATTFLFGAFGVEMFFALSGFLIGNILIKIFSIKPTIKIIFSFLGKRWMRTLPLYFIVLGVNFMAYNYFDFKYLLFIQNFYAPIKGPFFNESWSLAIEEWSYIIFPTVLFIFYFFNKNIKVSIRNTIIFGIVFSWIIRIIYISIDLIDIRTVVIARIDAIFYGIGIALLIEEKNRFLLKHTRKIFWLSIITLAVSYLVLRMGSAPFNFSQKSKVFKYTAELIGLPLVNVCFSLLIPHLLVVNRSLFVWFDNLMTFISKVSYSVYLWHFSFLYIFVFNLKNSDHLGYYKFFFLFVVYWLTTFGFSYLSYRFIETPFIKLRDNLIK